MVLSPLLFAAAVCWLCAAAAAEAEEAALVAWIREGGGSVSALQRVETRDGLRGVFATDAIPNDATLATVPWSHVLAADAQCEAVALLRRELALGARSAYAPYLASMASYAPNMPFLWHPTALDAVARLPPHDWTRHRAWFEEACGAGDLDGDALTRRALELFLPRSVGDADVAFIMCPVFDLYNHRNAGLDNVRIRIRKGEFIEVYAARDVAKGEQLFYSYGDGTPALFRDYAFVEFLPQRWTVGEHEWLILPPPPPGVDDDSLAVPPPPLEWVSVPPSSREAFDASIAPMLGDLVRRVPDPALPAPADDPAFETHLRLALEYRAALAAAIDAARRHLPAADDLAAFAASTGGDAPEEATMHQRHYQPVVSEHQEL